ncbi:F-box/LRR-repeat protein 6 [Basidiobolus ranarum]|uniref:F-box/LRR-repeat protein 6 n=1 Tax=Basidiobolus ranarum TaxID=34480 RepID=A0ABR2WHE7_9FUNG
MSMLLSMDCIYEILGFLCNDMHSLLCCCLVSKSWFKMSSAILYRNPCKFFKILPLGTVDQKRALQLLRVWYACIYPELQPSEELESLLNVSSLGPLTTNYLSLVNSIDLSSFNQLVQLLLSGDSVHSVGIRIHTMSELRVLWKIYQRRYASSNLRQLVWDGCFPLEGFIDNSTIYTVLEDVSLDWLNGDNTLCPEHLDGIYQVTPRLSSLHIRVRFSKGDFTQVLGRLLKGLSPNTLRSLVLEGVPVNITTLLESLLCNHRHSLKRLELNGYSFHSISLSILTKFSILRCISLAFCRGVDDSKLQQITQCSQLIDMDISKTDVTLTGLTDFIKSTGSRLRRLILNHLSMNIPNGLEVISDYCPKLTKLELRRTVYNCRLGPRLISRCPQLESLSLGDEVGNPPPFINTMVTSIIRSGNRLKFLDLGYCHLTITVLPLIMLKTGLSIVGPIRCVGVELDSFPYKEKNQTSTRMKGVTSDVYYDITKGLELPVAIFPPTFFMKPPKTQLE